MTGGPGTSFTVVIATLRRPDRLATALASLAALDPPPAEVLVIDGDEAASARPVVDVAAGTLPCPVRHVASPAGLTRQRNRGLDAAAGDAVVFLDDDARLEPEALRVLAEVYADPGVVGATGKVVEPTSNRVGGQRSRLRRALPGGGRQGTFTPYGYPHRIVDVDTPRDVQFMSGCFMSARLAVAREVRFDEALPGYALAEDEDFSCRLAARGRLRYDPGAVVHHDNAGFGGRDRRAFNRTVVVHRAYLFRKNFPQTPRARAGFALLVPLLVVHRLLNRDLVGVRGIVDGVRALRRGEGPGALPHAAVPVLFVSSHAQRGGSETYLERVMGALGNDWWAGVVSLDDGPLVERLRALGAQVTVLPTSGGRLSMLRSAGRLRRLLRELRPRLVHANGVKAAVVTVVAARGLGVPVVWVKHDHSWDGPLARWVARRCAEVVAVSGSALSAVREAAPAASVVAPGVVVHPVDPAEGRTALREIAGAPADAPMAVLVGRLDVAKGGADACTALARARLALPRLRLVLVGAEEPSQPEFPDRLRRRAVELGVGDAVTFAGYRPNAHTLIAGADVLLVPSRAVSSSGMGSEGFGLVAAEAMALGTPVVAYADGALPEVLGDCGVLVPAGDVDAMADALVDVVCNTATRDRLVACGRARATSFTLDVTADAMRAVYRRRARPGQ